MNDKALERLLADIEAFDPDDHDRLMRSGFEHEEALEYMRLTNSER